MDFLDGGRRGYGHETRSTDTRMGGTGRRHVDLSAYASFSGPLARVETPTLTMLITVTKEQKAAIKKAARSVGLSVAEFGRRAILELKDKTLEKDSEQKAAAARDGKPEVPR